VLELIAGGDLLKANIRPCLAEVEKNVDYFRAARVTTAIDEEESLYYAGITSRVGSIGADCLYLLYKTQTGDIHPHFPPQVHLNHYVNDIYFKYELSHERLVAIKDSNDRDLAAMRLIGFYSQCCLVINFTNDSDMSNLRDRIRERFSSLGLPLVNIGICLDKVEECVSNFILANADEKNLAKLVYDVRPIAWDDRELLYANPSPIQLNHYVNGIFLKPELSRERLVAIKDSYSQKMAAMDLISLYSQCYLLINFTDDSEMYNLRDRICERFLSLGTSLVDIGLCLEKVEKSVSKFISDNANERNIAKLIDDVRPIAWDHTRLLFPSLFSRIFRSAISKLCSAPNKNVYERIPG
jgi:hypothetical protein